MIDHVTISVNDLTKSKIFYEKAFAPFNYHIIFGEEGRFWAFDIGNGALFEIAQFTEKNKLTKCHIAFRAKSQEQVQHFHEAAISAGARCNGAPGLRTQYTPTYYVAFVLDLDGHNIEAVFDAKNIGEKCA